MKFLLIALGIVVVTSTTHAADPLLLMRDITYVEQSERVRIDVLFEGAIFLSDAISLSGAGLGFGARFGLDKQWALGVELAQALTLESGAVAALYTGLRGRLHFALSGDFDPSQRRLQWEGQTVALTVEARRPIWAIQIGVDQYLFNGTTTVTPGSGIGFGMSYDTQAWGMTWTARLGSGILILNQNIIYPLNFALGTSIGF